jgi:hypothetical protein
MRPVSNWRRITLASLASEHRDTASAALRVAGAQIPHCAMTRIFLPAGNDADPDIPILKQAKAEYAKLQ